MGLPAWDHFLPPLVVYFMTLIFNARCVHRPEHDVLCANTMHHCMNVSFCLCVFACFVVSILACVCVCVRACVCACMHACFCVFVLCQWLDSSQPFQSCVSAAYLIVFQDVNRPVHTRQPGRPVVPHFGSHGEQFKQMTDRWIQTQKHASYIMIDMITKDDQKV